MTTSNKELNRFTERAVGSVVVILGIALSGCNDPVFLMNDSERAFWRAQRGIPEKEVRLLQVQNLSRDLEYCSQRTNGYSLTDEDFQRLSRRKNTDFRGELAYKLPSCQGIINNLFRHIQLALETKNSRKSIRQALVDGKEDAVLR
ncbi:MAG: hypothetical protein ACFB0C_22380 [Leptolyngbyaceae cyanobacterium]